ncbi:hypothetical protein [Phenylobacterium sp.]|uniref:hypothetical protein n=1 Tax=Phenylobacterium sp. TaxID=1871053 RepID=UPI00301BDB9B
MTKLTLAQVKDMADDPAATLEDVAIALREVAGLTGSLSESDTAWSHMFVSTLTHRPHLIAQLFSSSEVRSGGMRWAASWARLHPIQKKLGGRQRVADTVAPRIGAVSGDTRDWPPETSHREVALNADWSLATPEDLVGAEPPPGAGRHTDGFGPNRPDSGR